MSKNLDEIRKKIDALDHKIHDVLMQRADLIDSVVKEKRKSGLPFVQPAREAQMIRRILKRHKGPLPKVAVVRIWRELVGAVSLLQVGLKVSVCVEEDKFITWDLAKSYFGSVVAMQRVSNSVVAVASVREKESSFAVLPWPKDEERHPWWIHLFDQDSDMKIVCALPYGGVEGALDDISNKALVVSKTDFMDSGEDRSFIVLEVDLNVSRGRIVDSLKALGFEPLAITTKKLEELQGRAIHLIEVDGFVKQDDERFEALADSFDGFNASCKAIGGYPVPPVYKKDDIMAFEPPVLTAPKTKKKKPNV